MGTISPVGSIGSTDTKNANSIVQHEVCATTITRGDAVSITTAPTNRPDWHYGVRTAPASGADLATVIGVADESVTGTTSEPVKVTVVVGGFCYKAKVDATVVATDPLVLDTAAGEFIKATASNIGGIKAAALTASGTLMDGTVAAGFASVWIF